MYLDNIFIYSNNLFKYTEHVQKMLQRLKDIRLNVNIKKYDFSVKEVKYLKLIISIKGVRIDPEKVYIITEWQAPNCIKDIQAFFGFTNFYWKFIYNFLGVIILFITIM